MSANWRQSARTQGRPSGRCCARCEERRLRFGEECLAALFKIGPPGPGDAELLLPLLTDASLPAGRRYALDSLVELGLAAKVTAGPLAGLLKDADPAIKRKAAVLLGQIGPAARSQALSGLLELLRDKNEEVSVAGLAALEKLGPPDKAEVELFRTALGDDSPMVRRFALAALTALGEEAEKAVPDLIALFQREKEAQGRVEALAALGKIKPKGREVIEVCTRALEDSDNAVVRQAAANLVAAANEASALPGLLKALDHADAEVSQLAAKALAEVKLDRGQVPALAAALERATGEQARLRLLDLLKNLGPDAAAALPALRHAQEHPGRSSSQVHPDARGPGSEGPGQRGGPGTAAQGSGPPTQAGVGPDAGRD